jgi:hypothetical protein
LYRESRYLLVLTENYAALRLLQQGQFRSHDPVIIFGSSFPKDQQYTQVYLQFLFACHFLNSPVLHSYKGSLDVASRCGTGCIFACMYSRKIHALRRINEKLHESSAKNYFTQGRNSCVKAISLSSPNQLASLL